jgi:hypothetical protein
MIIAFVPIVVLVIGLLMWALAGNPIVKDAGRGMFFIGLAVAVFISARATVHLP